MTIPPPDPHTAKFLDALDAFMQNPPRDLPEGAADMLKQAGQNLRGYGDTQQQSPGEKEAQKFTDGTGAPYMHAAKHEDQPSPGQREFEKAMKEAQEAAQALAAQASQNGNAT
jgi:hypothetical protein